MAADATRTQGEGALFGALAGIVFGLSQVAAAAATAAPAVAPFRDAASLLLGPRAFDELSPGAAILVGGLVHLALSVVFGWAYGLLAAAVGDPARRSAATGAVLGAAYGSLLWLLNVQVVARFAFPWLLTLPQGQQLALHVLLFGLPLGLMLASSERGHARAMLAAPAGGPTTRR